MKFDGEYDTSGFFYGDLRTILSHICGAKSRYFKPEHDLFLKPPQSVFVPKPDQSVSFTLTENTIENLTRRNINHICGLQKCTLWSVIFPCFPDVFVDAT